MLIGGTTSFEDVESILATRISLIRSLTAKEARNQLGNLKTPLQDALLELECQCLVQLSVAARASGQHQIALNSIIKARSLLTPVSSAEEFANVLWAQNERRSAAQYLSRYLTNQNNSIDGIKKAVLFGRLVSFTSVHACKLKTHILKGKLAV